MSLFPVIVVFGLSFPPIFFELLLSLAIFLAGAPGTCANRYLRLCLASGVVQHRALLLLVLFDIATVRLRFEVKTLIRKFSRTAITVVFSHSGLHRNF
ncbi:protein AaeX [Escherichia coli]|uniref:Protein AaeX n=1 Tax=Escherichia coli TaxID=562 RepID=A0A377BXI7_ECOLX|nr:protein AaeX [Escherichia coli]